MLVKSEIKKEQQREETLVLNNFSSSSYSPLTMPEKEAVKRIWGENISYNELGVFKKYRGFDPRYMSHFIYLPLISHKLNNYHYTKLFEHKSLQGFIAKSNLRSPYCFVRCIDQEYYDNEMNQLTLQQAMEVCVGQDYLIVKDSIDSSGGQSVEKLNLSLKNDRRQDIERVFVERKRDFVIQECIKQHSSMSRFNSSSINTLRVTTLYLNGKYSTLSIVLRLGKQGMNVDNWGAGGIMIGVSVEGKLCEYGYDILLNKFHQYNGIIFKNEIIEQVPSLLTKIEEAHKNCFSLCKFIGWDICFNEYNEPIIIELNSSQPGVIGEQLCTGPIFGERTQEVIDYCNEKSFNYNRAIFKY